MNTLKTYIVEMFNFWVEWRWLREIDRAQQKYRKIEDQRKRQAMVVHALYDRYRELYPKRFDGRGTAP